MKSSHLKKGVKITPKLAVFIREKCTNSLKKKFLYNIQLICGGKFFKTVF